MQNFQIPPLGAKENLKQLGIIQVAQFCKSPFRGRVKFKLS